MSLPKKLSGVRYLSSAAFNCYVDVINPNAGQASDGTPNPPLTVKCRVPANVAPWRSKEVDKAQTRIGQSAFKIVVRYPKSYLIDTGCQLILRGQTHEIESLYDPDGQQIELHMWTWTNNPTAGSSC